MDLLVNIDVADLEPAVAFYQAALGLRVGRRLGPDVAEMLGAAAPIYLIRQPAGRPGAAAAGVRGARDYRRHWTPVHLDFVVPALEPAIARAVAAGAAREGELNEAAWGRFAVFADPFGHGFCLLEFRGRGYDAIAAPAGAA